MRNNSNAISVPALLDRLAVAGPRGLELTGDSAQAAEIRHCIHWGYPLTFGTNHVELKPNPDSLVAAWIESETPAIFWDKLSVAGFLQIGSTNDEALELARRAAQGGTVVFAETQTSGRGRSGRKWHSPRGSGLYFSVITYPRPPASHWPMLTHGAAVALFDALREVESHGGSRGGLRLDIKWPNDVLLSGKKVAGILLETSQAGPLGPAAVVGIGVNLAPGSVPEDLRDEATCVSEEAGIAVPRRALLVRLLVHLQRVLDLFDRGRFDDILSKWKERSSMWSGSRVYIVEGGRSRLAVTCGLSDVGGLRVRTEDGSEEILMAGDLRIRPTPSNDPKGRE